jgi:hypothetical protein
LFSAFSIKARFALIIRLEVRKRDSPVLFYRAA